MKTSLAAVTLLFATTLGYRAFQEPQDAQDMPKPGPQHALLQQHVGTWDAVVIIKDMNGAEQRSKATMTTTKSGEFHTIDDFRGEFMGMPFTGHGMNSYCPVRKKYVSSWTDSMAPSPLTILGSYDETTKKLSMQGECVGMSGKLEPCRTVTEYQDADHYAWEMFGPGADGKEAKQLRIEYTRKK